MLRFLHLLLFLSTYQLINATLPVCSKAGCPSGGIWSEWVTKEKCSTTCGSCSSQYFTRECLSRSADCKCSGPTSRYLPCNTKVCVSPAQRTCCIPYVSMLINGSFQCGPFPKITETTQSCCPPGGLWSEWSKFGNNGTAWVRSRKCVSLEAGCECTGALSESKSSCPCTAPANVGPDVQRGYFHYAHNASIDQASCSYTAYLVVVENASNDPCKNGRLVLIRFVRPGLPSTSYEAFRPFSCDAIGLQPNNNKFTMHCNTESLYWEMDYDNVEVAGWAQINVISNGSG